MAFIEISNLDAAGSDSSASANSFLTELEKTDTVQISGGRRGRSSRRTTDYCCWSTPPACEPPILVPDNSINGGGRGNGGGGGRGNGGGGGRGNGGGGGR